VAQGGDEEGEGLHVRQPRQHARHRTERVDRLR
jgi:hypothetical protein